MPGTRVLTIAAALALACGVVGCTRTHAVGRHRALHVALTEYRIAPQSIRARAGLLTIFVHNFGRRTHNLVVSLDGQSVGSTKPIWPGASAKLTVYLTPGTYLIGSTILSDQALGEYGTLVVR